MRFIKVPIVSFSAPAAQGVKRKAEQAESDEGTYAAQNWRKLKDTGGLGKLTNDVLKVYLRHHNLTQAGKKADLILRIEQHMDKKP